MKIIIPAFAAALLLCGCFGPVAGNQAQEGADSQVSTFAALPKVNVGPMELPVISATDEIIRHDNYVICYNREMYIPNWVAYELTSKEIEGNEERGDRMFSMDPKYRKTQAMREDYYDSGWTKGHMAPAADFRWSASAMDETFYLTNVCPQNERLNGKDWEYLERQVRGWAGRYGKVWVVTGPIVGENKYGRIGERGVVVPDSFFKAVLIEKKGKYYSIAFVMDNDSKRYYLEDCAVSVNYLEEMTGIDFFPALDDSIEDKIEGQLRPSEWGIGR